MSKQKLTYKKMLGYLKNVFSNAERHALEKEVMQDPFDAEAFEGLSELPADVLEAHMKKLQSELNSRTQKREGVIGYQRYAIAASLLFLVGLGLTMLVFNKGKESYQIVKNTTQVEDAVVVNDSQTNQGSEEHELFQEPDLDLSKRKESDVAYEAVEEGIKIEKEEVSNVNSTTKASSYSKKSPAKPEKKSEDDYSVSEIEVAAILEKVVVGNVEDISKKERDAVEAKTSVAVFEETADMIADESQEIETWSGTITDNYGRPLPGVNIIVKDNNEGTVTDFDGNYTLKVPKGAEIQANYLGFEDAVITYESHKEVVMDEDSAELEEVVVVGYGSRKKAKVSGLNRKMETKRLPSTSSNRVEEALTGKAAGVSVIAIEEETSDIINSSARSPLGSYSDFKNWVIDHLDDEEFEKGKEYKFSISFDIDVNGVLKNVEVLSEKEKNSRKHIKKIVASSENWHPAFENGKAVKSTVEFILEVAF